MEWGEILIVDIKIEKHIRCAISSWQYFSHVFTCQKTEKPFYLLTIYNTDPEKLSYYVIEYDLHYDVVNLKTFMS